MKRILFIAAAVILLVGGYFFIKKCQYDSVLEQLDEFRRSGVYTSVASAAQDTALAWKVVDSIHFNDNSGRVVEWGPILFNEKMDKCLVLYYDELKSDPKMLRSNVFFGVKDANRWIFNYKHLIALNSYVWDKDEKQMVEMVEKESLKTLINDGLANFIPCSYNYDFVSKMVDDFSK